MIDKAFFSREGENVASFRFFPNSGNPLEDRKATIRTMSFLSQRLQEGVGFASDIRRENMHHELSHVDVVYRRFPELPSAAQQQIIGASGSVDNGVLMSYKTVIEQGKLKDWVVAVHLPEQLVDTVPEFLVEVALAPQKIGLEPSIGDLNIAFEAQMKIYERDVREYRKGIMNNDSFGD